MWPASPSPSRPIYVPETAGVVQERQIIGQEVRFRLADGREVRVPANTDYLGGGQPETGDLLLAGTLPERWVARATLLPPKANVTPPGCYGLPGRASANATQVFKTIGDARGDVTMRFPKAVDWTDVGQRDGTELLVGVTTCINPRGEAFAHTW